MTMVEVLVATGALAVVLAIALAMMMETRHAARQTGERQAMLQQSQAALTRVGSILSGAVAPRNLTALTNPSGVVNPIFTQDRLTVVVYDRQGGGFLNQVTVDSSGATGGQAQGPMLQYRPVAETIGSQTARALDLPLIDAGSGDYRTRMTFAFARAGAPGESPEYRESWPSAEWPDLVRITVVAESEKAGYGRIELSTAVIPGGVRGGGKPEPVAGSAAETTAEDASTTATTERVSPAVPTALEETP
jgi:hypothetical protein